MSTTSIIFFCVFFIPLIAFLVWLMRQDKRRGTIGLVVLGAMVAMGIFVLYLMRRGG